MNVVNRIGIMGSAGSGKTMLAQVLSDTLEIPLVDEGVREWLTLRDLKAPACLSWNLQVELQEYYVASKILNESKHQAFVSDRTTIDAVVNLQLRHHCGDIAQTPLRLVHRALEYAGQTYDRVVLLRWDGIPKARPDGVRDIEPHLLQSEYDLCLSLCNLIGLQTTIVCALPDKRETAALVDEIRFLSSGL